MSSHRLRRLAAVLALLAVLLAGLGTYAVTSDTGRAWLSDLRHGRALSQLPGVTRQANLRVAMADGVHLATDVYLPTTTTQPVPTLLIRLPYGKTRYPEARHWIRLFAPQGYAVVVQDMRGRHRSEGVFTPWAHARTDGAATLDWITAQPWSDGQVGTIGCSALGESQILLAAEGHPAHKAMIPIGAGGALGTAGGLHQPFGLHDGGIPNLAAGFGWFLRYGGKTPSDMAGPSGIDFGQALRSLPVRGMVARARTGPTDFDRLLDSLENPTDIRAMGYITATDRLAVPSMVIDDWYDPSLNATLQLARMMDQTDALRHLVITPGLHCSLGRAVRDGAVGDITLDPAQAVDTDHLVLAFMDHMLRDGPPPELPKVQVYEMQSNRWRQEGAWPPEGARTMRYVLHEETLQRDPPQTGWQQSWTSDPADPVPSIGGAICCTGDPATRAGPLDLQPHAARGDLLRFTSPPLAQPLPLAGPGRIEVTLAADRPDADLIVHLLDVFPDGRAIPIQTGALRLRYRNGFDQSAPLPTGQPVRVRVNLRDIAYHVAAGHRLRLTFAGSDFPRLARNPGVASDPNRAEQLSPVQITVSATPEAPAVLTLSVSP